MQTFKATTRQSRPWRSRSWLDLKRLGTRFCVKVGQSSNHGVERKEAEWSDDVSTSGVNLTALTRRPDFQCPPVCAREKLNSPTVLGVVSNVPILISNHLSLSNTPKYSTRSCLRPSGRVRLRFTGASHPWLCGLIFTVISIRYVVIGESVVVLHVPLISSQQILSSSAMWTFSGP